MDGEDGKGSAKAPGGHGRAAFPRVPARDAPAWEVRGGVGGSPSAIAARPSPSLERGHGPQVLRNSSLAACPLHPFYLAFGNADALKGWIVSHCKQKGIQAPGPWMGPRPPRPRAQAAFSTPAAASLPGPVKCSLHTPRRRTERRTERRRRACCVGTYSPGIGSGQRAARALGVQSGAADGLVLTASRGTHNVPSQYSEPIWAGSPSTASLSLCLRRVEGHEPWLVVRRPPWGNKKAGPVVPPPSLLLCPPTCSLGCCPADTCQLYKTFRSLFRDGPGRKAYFKGDMSLQSLLWSHLANFLSSVKAFRATERKQHIRGVYTTSQREQAESLLRQHHHPLHHHQKAPSEHLHDAQ